MRKSFLQGGRGKMGIIVRFDWDDEGTPTLILHRNRREAAISLNDAHHFAEYESAIPYAAKISSALGLDYWSSLDRHAVLDTILMYIDDLVMMPPAPMDGLDSKRKMLESGITGMQIKADGRTVLEAGL
jgi:hypothetical protein